MYQRRSLNLWFVLGTILVSSWAGAEPLFQTDEHSWQLRYKDAMVLDLQFSPDGKLVATANGDKSVKLFDAQSGKLLHTMTGHTATLRALAFNSDGSLLASGGYNNDKIRLWKTSDGSLVRTLAGQLDEFAGLAFSPDGQWLVSNGSETKGKSRVNTLRVFQLSTGELKKTLFGKGYATAALTQIAFSPDGKVLAASASNKRAGIYLWDATTWKQFKYLKHPSDVPSLAFSSDGKLLAGGYGNKGKGFGVKLWRTEGWQEQADLKPMDSHVISVAFVDGSKYVAATSYVYKNRFRIWDCQSGSLVQEYTRKGAYNKLMRVSPGGGQLALAYDTRGDLFNPTTLSVYSRSGQDSGPGVIHEPAAQKTAQDKEPDVRAAKKAQVKWKGKWYQAVVLEEKDGRYLIHYKGYGSDWDEWVGSERIRLSD